MNGAVRALLPLPKILLFNMDGERLRFEVDVRWYT
jgi:hypothetical protein